MDVQKANIRFSAMFDLEKGVSLLVKVQNFRKTFCVPRIGVVHNACGMW